MNTEISVSEVDDISEAIAFLKPYEESSQFLINNLREFGPRVTEDQYSGNFKVVKANGKIVAVFMLARGGNLYAQADSPGCAAAIIESCLTENFPIKGFLGSWNILFPLYEYFVSIRPDFAPGYYSKEILYRLTLENDSSQMKHHPNVRLLEAADFEIWLPLRTAYLEELGLASQLGSNVMKERFELATATKKWWGYFEDQNLVSITGLNSGGEEIGQVGGVFTVKERRQQGLSKAAMLHMLKDCHDLHKNSKSILFTGENDLAAQKLYESIGYERIGHFALILT